MENITKLWVSVLALLLFGACDSEKKDYLTRMAEQHRGDAPVGNASAELSSAEVPGEEVVYATVNGTEVTGYLAKADTGGGQAPGIIVIHEWWGLNDNIRMMADKLAGQGYTALAVDLYNGKVATSPDSAGMLAQSVQQEQAIDNLRQAFDYLEKQGSAEIGSIGWCFGGGWSLQTALALPQKLDAAVVYYGQPVTEVEQLKELQMPLLGIFGAEDESIPPKKVKEFEEALDEAGVINTIHLYEGAGHAFANPSGTQYQEKAAEDAWQKTMAFFDEHLKQ